jgi:hypothetical protein
VLESSSSDRSALYQQNKESLQDIMSGWKSDLVIYDTPTERVNHFNYLGCTISIFENKDLETKLRKFNRTCGTIRRALNKKTWKETQIKFYKFMAIPRLTYSSETWTLTKSKRKR